MWNNFDEMSWLVSHWEQEDVTSGSEQRNCKWWPGYEIIQIIRLADVEGCISSDKILCFGGIKWITDTN